MKSVIWLINTRVWQNDLLLLKHIYGVWLVFIVTLSIFYNTWVKSFGIVAFLTILSVILISILTNIFGDKLAWSLSNLTELMLQMLITGSISTDLIMTVLITAFLCGMLLVGSVSIFKTKELASS